MNLLDNIKIFKPSFASTYGSPNGSTFIDCQGAAGCLFILHCSSALSSSGTILVQQATGTSTAGAWASTFSNKVILGSSHRVMAVDVVKPIRRYVRLRTLTTTGVGILAITYNLKRRGSTEVRSVINVTSNQPSGIHLCTT